MNTLLVAALGLTLATPALSRGGEDTILTRGSQAWFASESGEHELRALVLAGRLTEAAPTALVVDLTSLATAEILVETSDSQVTDACQMVDHWSRRGTVLKKEVFCNVSPAEPRNDLTRGSNAWALVEGIEHSLRLAVITDASVKEAVSFADADLDGATFVRVTVGLTNGDERAFLCTRTQSSRSGTRPDLNCAAL